MTRSMRSTFARAIALASTASLVGVAAAQDWHAHASYALSDNNRSISVHFLGGRSVKYVAAGYAISDVTVVFDRDNGSAVAFLDLSGVSVGGEVHVLCSKLDNCDNSIKRLYASKLTAMQCGARNVIELLQHDSGPFFFVSDLVDITASGISTKVPKSCWDKVISTYVDDEKNSSEPQADSRYEGYVALAALKSGDTEAAAKSAESALRADPENMLAISVKRKIADSRDER